MTRKISVDYQWATGLKAVIDNLQALTTGGISLRSSAGNVRAILNNNGLFVGNATVGTGGSASWVLGVLDTAAEPGANPSGGCYVYSYGGALKVRQPNGSVITIGGSPDLPPVAVTYGASIALNASLGNIFRVTMTGDTTFTAPTNPTDGQQISLELTASGGARTPTLTVGSSGAFKFGTDITAVTAVASGTTDIIGLRYNATAARWWVVAYVKGF